jgi:tetratricopeptide (TPR) repeat protein
VYHLVGDRQALDNLLKHHPAAAAGIGDLYAAAQDWERAIAEYRKLDTDQPADSVLLTKLAAVYEAAGRTREAVPHLAKASVAKPDDALLFLKVTALQAWFGQDKEFADTSRRGLEWAKDTTAPFTADRVANGWCLLPSTDKAQIDAALALARKAVDLGGKGHPYLPYFQLAVGMAEYRGGHFAAADATLLDAAERGKNTPHVAGPSAFYRALCLCQQGKEAEARKLATEAAAKMKPLPTDENNPLIGDVILDDLILWLAYREAKAMIRFDDAPPAKGRSDNK